MKWKKELQRLAGKNNFFDSKEYQLLYGYDAQPISGEPAAVVFGRSTKQIARIIKFCNSHNIKVVPRGSGSGMTGGAVPVNRRSIILNLTRMNRILAFSPENLFVKVEPGVINSELNEYLAPHGFFYPPDPASSDFSTIGGNVAENAGGPSAVKYGVTADYVLNLKVVLPTGRVIETRRDLLKSVSGYDLTKLFVGSEGTLGVFSEITLKILPKNKHQSTILLGFDSYSSAALFIPELYRSSILPMKLEFMDEKSIFVTRAEKKLSLPPEIKALVIISVDAPTQSGVLDQVQKIKQIVDRFNPDYAFLPDTEEEIDLIWQIRKSVSPSLYKFKPIKVNEDVVVPISRLSELFQIFDKLEKEYNVDIISFGHIGDGNLHTNIMMSSDQVSRKESIVNELFHSVVLLGGSISGEHGIGITKRKFLGIEKSMEVLRFYKKLKKMFDPNNIMNPGKAI